MSVETTNVFIQKTPNPDAYKFVSSTPLIETGGYEVKRSDMPTGVPWIDTVFESWSVDRVYVAQNFITALKSQDADWTTFDREMREFLTAMIREGEFNEQVFPDVYAVSNLATDEQLVPFFQQRILPATQQDGGGIYLKAYHDGEMELVLTGACFNCPHAPTTVQKGIVEPLNQQLQLKKVRVNEARPPA